MELQQLLVLLEDVLHIADLHLSGLCDFLLFLGCELASGISLLIIVHSSADLVLALKDLDLGIFTPDHELEGALLLKTVEHSLMEIMDVEGVFAQEVLDILLESLLLFFVLALLHRLHEGALLELCQEHALLIHREERGGLEESGARSLSEHSLRPEKHHHFYNY